MKWSKASVEILSNRQTKDQLCSMILNLGKEESIKL